MPIFNVNGKRYKVREEDIAKFATDYPDAYTVIEDQGVRYGVKPADYKAFITPKGTTHSPTASHAPEDFLDADLRDPAQVEQKQLEEREAEFKRDINRFGVDNIPSAQQPQQPAPVEQTQKTDEFGAPVGTTHTPTYSHAPLESFIDEDLRKLAYQQEQADMSATREQVRELGKNVKEKLQQSQPQEFIWGGFGSDPTPQMAVRAAKMEMAPTTQENRAYVAANNALRNAQRIIDEADRNGADGSGNETSFVGGALRGFGQKVFDPTTWDMGLTEMGDAKVLLDALEIADNGGELTEAQRTLLDAKAVEMATNAYFGSYLGYGYKAGQVSAESIPFMLEMAINPAAALGKGASAKLTRYALKRYGKEAIRKNAAKYLATKAATRVGADVVGAATMAATTGALGTTADALRRMSGDIEYDLDENGRPIYGGHTEGDDALRAWYKAIMAGTIERASEMAGGYIAPIGKYTGLSKLGGDVVRKITPNGVLKAIDNMSYNDAVQFITNLERKAQWNGVVGEFGEEIYGGILNSYLVGDQTRDTDENTGIFNRENLIETFLGVGLMGGFFSTVKTGAYAVEYPRAKRRLKRADVDAINAFGSADLWGTVKEQLASTDAKTRGKAVRDILADANLTPEQKQAAVAYVGELQRMDGVRIGLLKHQIDAATPAEEVEVEQSFENGYTLQTPQEKNDARTMLEECANAVRRLYALPEDTDVDEFLGENPLASLLESKKLGQDDSANQIVLNYLNAKSTVEGMYQAVRDDIDGKIAQSDAQVDSRISKTDGRIHPATMKQDNRAVYIMSGDVVLLDDGTIDTANSSESIIVKDAETGKMEFSDPASLLNVGEIADAEQTKEALREQIRQSVAGQAEAEILGTLAFAQGDTYVLTDEEGAQHQAQIVADNGDGTVQVALDGATEAVQMPKEQVQAMNDATNRGRAAAYIEQQNAQRESAMQEVAEEQQPIEEQPIEQPQVEESALSRIPTDEEGNQLFEQAPAQDTWSALVELNEGDMTEATDTAQQMLDNAKKELDKATSVKPKGGATVAEIQQDKAERKARIAEAQQKVDYWTEVLNAQQATQEQAAQEVAQTEEVAPTVEETQVEEVADHTEEATKPVEQEEQIAPQEVAVQTQPATEQTEQETQAEAVPTQEQTEQEEQKQRKQQRVRIKVKKDEEARRKPLRKRAQAWANKVGVEAVIIERFEDVENETARKAIQMHEEQKSGQRIPGWYSGGKVYIYLPHATDISDLDQTYIHEVVAHHGMKQMLGEEGYKQFCLKVWDMMEQTLNERELNRWLAYPGVKGDKAKAADEYIAHLAETTESLTELDQSVWDKIVELLRDALRQLGVSLEGDDVAFDPSGEFTNKLIVDALHASKRNLKQSANNQSESKQDYELAAQSIEEQGGVVDEEKGDVMFAVRDVLEGKQREKAIRDLMTVTGRSREEVEQYLKAEESLARIITSGDNEAFLDLQVDESVPSIWKNSDYPQGTVEFSNICRKRLPFTMIYQQLQKEFPNTVFDASTLETIRGVLKENGIDVACGLCFVEDRRQLLGEIGEGFIDALKGKAKKLNKKQAEIISKLKTAGDNYIPTLYELITLDGMKKLRQEHSEIANAFIAYNSARGMQAGRLFQAYSAYHRDILKWTKKKIETVNKSGGLRIFSFSDFEAHHLIDLVQVLTDCATKGVKVQGYTKVPEFARAVRNTGMKLNRSLIAKGVGVVNADYIPQQGEAVSPNVINGKRLLLDTIEGIDVTHPDFFDSSRYPNVGNILVGINDEQIRQAMADPFVDYIIPFHTGLSAKIRKQKGIDKWVNYKLEQLEKIVGPKGKLKNADKHGVNIYTEVLNDDIQTERQFVERYLEVCKQKGWVPKFYRFLNTDADGNYVYTSGYYKLLLDFKMFDRQGRILPQEVVKPIFDQKLNKRILEEYVEGEKAKAPDEAIYEKVKEALAAEGKISFRITPEMDAEYLEAVESGDMEKAQRMVNDAAERAGYSSDASWRKSHLAPTNNGENVNPFNTEEIVPADYWTHPEWYTQIRHYQTDRESYFNMLPAINKYKRLVAEGKQEEADQVTVKMYRGVDKTANKREGGFRNGDWITPSRSYALLSAPYGKARVIEEDIPLKHIWWDGNSINEWGFDNGDAYAYKDTKNNRKLLDAVTYDDEGNVIPLSKRFNPREADVRFRTTYHGTPAIFERFDHSFMGSGEGNQAFGWGTYVTEEKGIGEWYAKVLTAPINEFIPERRAIIDAQIELNKVEQFAERLREEIQYAKDNIAFYEERIRNGATGYELEDAQESIEHSKEGTLYNEQALTNAEAKIESARAAVAQAQEVYERARVRGNVYQVEIPDDNGYNYLSWEGRLTPKQMQMIASQAEKEGLTDIFYRDEDSGELVFNGSMTSGEREYRDLKRSLGSDKAASEFLSRAGFTGIKYFGDGGNQDVHNYVIFNDADLEIKERTSFRTAPTFLSNAAVALEGIKQEKATPQQWLAMLKKAGGIKAGEDKWIGLSEWLEQSEAKTLTKQEVADFIKENQIQIEEVEYDELNIFNTVEYLKFEWEFEDIQEEVINEREADEKEFLKEMKTKYGVSKNTDAFAKMTDAEHSDYETLRRLTNTMAIKMEVYARMAEKYGKDFVEAFGLADGIQNTLRIKDELKAKKYLRLPESRTMSPTRKTYTTDGLDNKREIALTVPTIESWNEGDLVHFGDAGEGRAIAWIRFGETTDEDGKRVLVIDEIQSKRHQEGREKGYWDAELITRLKDRENTLMDESVSIVKDILHKQGYIHHSEAEAGVDGRFDVDVQIKAEEGKLGSKGQMDRIKAIAQEINDVIVARHNIYKNLVPEAPFEKNWAELAMKRMLRYAAEHGFDKVAWTKGDQQAERYSIGGVISKIGKNESNNIDEQNFEVGLAGAESMLYLTTDNDGKIIHSLASEYVGRTLSEVFGKELAVKMLNAKENTAIEGEGLRIGGEGMRAFYDQMLPSFMRKYAKKWGATVQDVTLPNVEEAGRTMHSVDVTDSMRESVMQGQTMFRVADPNRYMFIGEQGARRLDAVEEATTRLDNLEVAKEMEAANKGPRTIKMATGWERGADGKWRYETLDGIDTQAIANITEGEYTLEDFVSDESLFDAYPSLRGVKVIVEPNTGQDYGGYWDAANNSIALVNYNDGGKYEQSSIIHEIQHAIQRKEGFTSGINPKSEMPISEEKRSQIEALRSAIRYTQHFGDVNLASLIHDDKKYGGYIWNTLSQETKDILTQLAYGRKKMSPQEAYIVLNARWDKLIQKELVGEGRYRRQAGEVEARNSAARRGMGLEERRAFLASETEDVAREDQLFIYDNIGSKNTIGQTAQMLGQDLATRVNLVERIDDITDPNPKIQERKRKARGWYDTESGEVFVVLPNVKSGQEARRTVFHEVVGHKGMRETVGEKRYNAFLEKVYRGASQTIRERIARRAATLGWDFNLATDEYLASLAEQGFEERENRNFFEVVRDLFLDLLSDAKIALGYRINDNDIRYMLWRTYQMQRSKGAMAVAEDVVMQQRLGVGEFDTSFRVAEGGNQIGDGSYHVPYRVDEIALSYPNVTYTINESATTESVYVTYYNNDPKYSLIDRPKVTVRFSNHESNAVSYGDQLAGTMDASERSTNTLLARLGLKTAVPIYGKSVPTFSASNADLEAGKYEEADITKAELYSLPIGTDISKYRGKLIKGTREVINTDKIGQSQRVVGYRYEDIPEVEAKREEQQTRFRETTPPSDDVRMRVAHTPYRETLIRQQYEERIKSGMYQSMEAMQDSMQSLHDTMLMILKEEGYGDMYIEDVASFENAYIGENRLSSTNLAEANAFANTVFQRLVDAIAAIAPNEEARTELIDYMFAKHGLERNEKMAERDAKREYDQQESRIASKAISASGAKTMAELIAEKRQKDYAGLTALTGKKQVSDAEKEAQRMVEEYENSHETAEIWERVQEVRKAILSKLYEGGLMSEDQMEQILDMYDYYIPLRGFDEKTVTDQYAYLTSTGGSFSSPIRKAGGRESKADDPFANLSAMAESAILQANRNMLVKQRFLNFVLRHPSDLVSVNRLWLRYDETNQEWVPEMPNILETDSPDEVARKVAEHEQAMKELSKAHPDRYKVSGDQTSMPYKVPSNETLKEHQVIVKRNGVDYVLTINGSPRLAQALNGLTNPDNDISGAIGAVLDAAQWVNRALSAAYTTRNPDFLLSNFMRDMLYTNTMVWVKESPNYALAFHKNYLKANPAQMKILYSKYNEGTLDMSDPMEAMFYKFIINGGETGYVNLKDVEQHKSELKEKLARSGGKLSVKEGLQILGDRLDGVNQSVENCARFAAFMTSQQMGRSVDRSIYDAKEISVNFNKKGAGSKFMGANGQTALGNTAAFTSGLGRAMYVFWNAAIQGTANFGRQAKRHPAKAFTAVASWFVLGALMAYLGYDDDDEDAKNSYFNNPEYVRRSNIMFHLGDGHYAKIPLPIEARAAYGLGELMVSVMSGKEDYSDGELASAIVGQMTQILPIDFMEGQGGFHAFIPSSVKPVTEIVSNTSWTGLPIYKDTPYNKDMPNWTKAYSGTNKYLVNLAATLNELSGGDKYTKGAIDLNPANIEYFLNGYFGGYFATADKLTKTAEMVVGARDFDPRGVLFLNRVLAKSDDRTQYRAVNNKYYEAKKEYETTKRRLRNYEHDTDEGIFNFAEKIDFLYNSEAYRRMELFDIYRGDIEDLEREIKEATSDEEKEALNAELMTLKSLTVDAIYGTEEEDDNDSR